MAETETVWLVHISLTTPKVQKRNGSWVRNHLTVVLYQGTYSALPSTQTEEQSWRKSWGQQVCPRGPYKAPARSSSYGARDRNSDQTTSVQQCTLGQTPSLSVRHSSFICNMVISNSKDAGSVKVGSRFEILTNSMGLLNVKIHNYCYSTFLGILICLPQPQTSSTQPLPIAKRNELTISLVTRLAFCCLA